MGQLFDVRIVCLPSKPWLVNILQIARCPPYNTILWIKFKFDFSKYE